VKAKIEFPGNRQAIITLSPESEEDQQAIKDLAVHAGPASPAMLNCRGFQYLKPEVEFLVQPMPRGD
jgi:hypothetical protein